MLFRSLGQVMGGGEWLQGFQLIDENIMECLKSAFIESWYIIEDRSRRILRSVARVFVVDPCVCYRHLLCSCDDEYALALTTRCRGSVTFGIAVDILSVGDRCKRRYTGTAGGFSIHDMHLHSADPVDRNDMHMAILPVHQVVLNCHIWASPCASDLSCYIWKSR